MIKKTKLFFGGYLIMLFMILIISKMDKYAPSVFGKWTTILTPVYIVLFFLVYYIIKKRIDERAK